MASSTENSILDREYIKSSICRNVYLTDLQKCPTKQSINSVSRFLSVKEEYSTTIVNTGSMGTPNTQYHTAYITGPSTSGSGLTNICNSAGVCKIRVGNYIYSNATNTQVTVNYPGIYYTTGTTIYNYAFIRYSISCSKSGYNKTTANVNPIYYTSTNSSATYSYYTGCTFNSSLRAFLLDSDKNIVQEWDIFAGTSTSTLTRTFAWYGTPNATYYFCVCPYNTQWVFPSSYTGYVYVDVGFYMYLEHKPYSYWSDSNQLVTYGEIQTTKTGSISYSIKNSTGSSLGVDTVSLDYSTSTSSSSGTWTSMGSKSLSSISNGSTATGSFSFTLPSAVSLTGTAGYYRCRLKVGTTTLNKKWEYSINNSTWNTHNTSSKTGLSAAYYILASDSSTVPSLSGGESSGTRITTIYIRAS